MASLSEAIAVRNIDDYTYSINLSGDWAVGTVPNGGYVTSCFLSVAKLHFFKTGNQPHTILLHLEFLRRTAVGAPEATFKVRELKIGQRTSTIGISLYQGDSEKVTGFLTNSNLETEEGLSLMTGWSLRPSSPVVDFSKLRENTDPNWERVDNLPFSEFRKASKNLTFWLPRVRDPHLAIVDEWIRMKNHERFHLVSLGLVNDMFPMLVDVLTQNDATARKRWYPTLTLSLDIKKNLPPEGSEFLFVRVQARSIRAGRLDLDVSIMDERQELVAVGHHASLILSASRNIAGREKPKETASNDDTTISKL